MEKTPRSEKLHASFLISLRGSEVLTSVSKCNKLFLWLDFFRGKRSSGRTLTVIIQMKKSSFQDCSYPSRTHSCFTFYSLPRKLERQIQTSILNDEFFLIFITLLLFSGGLSTTLHTRNPDRCQDSHTQSKLSTNGNAETRR